MPDNWQERRAADRRATVTAWLKGADRRERQRRAIVSARQADWYERYSAAQAETE